MSDITVNTLKTSAIQTRSGVSEIAIDKLKGASSAGSMTVVGEGGTTTTNLQQGLCKAWCKWSLADQSAAIDSFNVGSITDAGTGTGTCNLTNAFSGATFATFHSSSQYHAWDDTGGSASTINLAAGNSSHSKVDTSRVHVGGFGDLA